MPHPAVLLITGEQPPYPVVTKITTLLVAAHNRTQIGRQRRYTSRLRPPAATPTVFVAAPAKVTLATLRRMARRPLPFAELHGPTVLANPPPQQTIRVVCATRTRVELQRHAPTSILSPPAVIGAAPLAQPLRTTLTAAALRARPARSRLAPPPATPAAAPLAPPVRTALVRSPRSRARSRLAAPATLAAATLAPAVRASLTAVGMRAAMRLRPVRSRLAPPTVVAPKPPISAWVKVILAPRRGTHSQLGRPQDITQRPPAKTAPTVVLAPRARGDLVRRAPHSRLGAPVSVAAAALARPVAVTLAPARRPKPRSARVAPVFYPVAETALQVTLARHRRPVPRSRLAPPVTYPPLVAVLDITTSGRTRQETQRRAPRSKLAPPTVVLPLPTLREQTVRVTIAPRVRETLQRRGPRSRLAPPTVVAVSGFVAPPVDVTLAFKTRADAQRRAPRSRLRPPAVIAPAVLAAAVKTRLAAPRPRVFIRSRLAPPAVVASQPFPQVATTLVAVRTRVDTRRRAPRSFRIQPAATPPVGAYTRLYRVAGLAARFARRILSRLRGPVSYPPTQTTVRAYDVAGPARDALRRRAPHSRLGAPAVVAPTPLPTQAQRTVRVALAVQARLGVLRRLPHSVLRPPATVAAARHPKWRVDPAELRWEAGAAAVTGTADATTRYELGPAFTKPHADPSETTPTLGPIL